MHTYFVGESCVFVHNGGCPEKPKKVPDKVAPKYVPKNVNGEPLNLPKTSGGRLINGTNHVPTSQYAHTQIAQQKVRNGDYIQTLEWAENGIPIKRVDWTDHGRPLNHTNPHEHIAVFKNGSWSFE